MPCELPTNYVAARAWNPERSTDTAVNNRRWGPKTGECSTEVAEGTLTTFQGLLLKTFAGETIQKFS